MYAWTASNNSSFLNGEREAKTLLGAVRDARAYVNGELGGEGKLTIYDNGCEVRQDTKTIFTNYKWMYWDID